MPDSSTPSEPPLTVGFPLYPNVTLVDFAGATQVFAEPFSGGKFRPIWLSKDTSCVETSEGVEVLPGHTFDDDDCKIDILFIPGGGALGPGGSVSGGVVGAMKDPEYLAFLQRTAESAQWVGSVCVGAFILAAAGLIPKNVTATTYWSQLPNLKRLGDKLDFSVDPTSYPRWEFPEGKQFFTGGGISSSVDLALELTRRISGDDASQSSQLSIQYAPDPPFDAGSPKDSNYPGAPPKIVEEIRDRQQKPFIDPIARAVDEFVVPA